MLTCSLFPCSLIEPRLRNGRLHHILDASPDKLHVSLNLSHSISRWHCLATGVRMAFSPPVPVVTVIDYPSGLLSNLQHHIVYMSRSLKCCSINLVTKNLHLALSIISHYLAYVLTLSL
jgi:hypothetical protein